MAAIEKSNVQKAISDLRSAIGDVEGLEWQLRDAVGHLENEAPEEKLGESGLIPQLLRVLREVRPLTHGDFQLEADIDDAVRELEAIR
jgi:hypothetical protein